MSEELVAKIIVIIFVVVIVIMDLKDMREEGG